MIGVVAEAGHHGEFAGDVSIANGIDRAGVNYIAMIPILVGAIQEQQKRIEELEKIVGKRY